MKIQTIINCVFAVAFVGYVVSQLNPTFDTITCNKWKVVDKDGKIRIAAATFADGQACVQWLDKDGKPRIAAGTDSDGYAGVVWNDKDLKPRIIAGTYADGFAASAWRDKNGKPRIVAGTNADGLALLPDLDMGR